MNTRTKISAPDGVNLTIGWKAEKFTVYIPKKGTPNNKRMEIHFDQYKDGNLCDQFADFIETSLSNVVEKWETLRQMHEWVTSSRQSWKETVTAQWETKLQLPTRGAKKLQKRGKQPDSVASARPGTPPQLVYNAKNDATISIPVLPLQDKHQKCPAIRVYPRTRRVSESGRTRKEQVIVFIPGAMTRGSKKRKEFTMGTELGADPEWLTFVADYVRYAASKWKNKEDVFKWESAFATFKDHITKLFKVYRSRLTGTIPVHHEALPKDPKLPETAIKLTVRRKRVWRLGPSQLPVPRKYINNPKLPGWTTDLIHNKGFGVFCTVAGAHTFDWTFPEDNEHKSIFFKADKRIDGLTEMQKNYQVTAGMDPNSRDTVVWVPTLTAFEMGTIHMPAIIGHNDENPTHEISVDPITHKTLVIPVADKNGKPRETKVDEEFGIDYNLLGSKDDSHLDKQRKNARKKRKNARKKRKKRNRVAKRKKPARRKPPAKRKKRTNVKSPPPPSAAANAEVNHSRRGNGAPKRRAKNKLAWLREVKETLYHDPTGNAMYEVYESPKGCPGQCLFTAVEDQLERCLQRVSMSHQQLRKLAVKHQLELANSDKYEEGVHRNKKACMQMRSGGKYGDHHEIAALAEALSVNVRVMVHRQGGSKYWVPTGDKKDLPTLRLLLEYHSPNSSANHYMSLRRVVPARRRETVNHSNVRRRETVNHSKITEVDGIVHKL